MQYLTKLRRLYENVELFDDNLEDYQRTAVQFLKDTPKSALFIDTGLGKTAICLRLIRDLIDNDEVNNVLIIAPLKVANQTWPDEIRIWEFSAPIPFKLIRNDDLADCISAAGRVRKSIPLTDKEKRKIQKKTETRMKKMRDNNSNTSGISLDTVESSTYKMLEAEYWKHAINLTKLRASKTWLQQDKLARPAIIHIINQEMVEWLVDSWSEDWPYDCVIFDESDAIKDASTRRWKALDSIKHLTKRFHQLTATPAAESYLGLYAQMKLLDGGKRLGRTMTEYKSRFFNVNPYNYKITMQDGASDEITRLISDITLVMKQEDFLKDVPPYVIENVTYPLSDDARKLYDAMSKSGGVTLPNGTQVYAEQAVSVLQKMTQIAAGFIYESEETLSDMGSFVQNRTIHQLHDDKIECLRELMSRYPDENFLISYYHQGSLEKLQKHFPEAIKMDRKGTQKATWNEGKIKMLLMHPKSGAHGLNLQRGGHIVINYDVYPSYGQFYQFLRRLARRGQTAKEVLVFNLLAEATYDMVVARNCWVEKRNKQEVLFDMLKSLKKRGFK